MSTTLAPALAPASAPSVVPAGRRIVNIVNFIRYDEPRRPGRDLLEPIVKQMALLREAGLPCTWLLQFDALVAGPYVAFLQANMPANHEVGLWFELNRMHCDAAGVAFRGADGLNWDYHVQAAFTVGYSPEDRVKLADVAVRRFREIFGRGPRTVAAWYIDAHTLARLSDRHGVEAFAVCRDQYGTDGYTFWGGPFSGGYYPSRRNTLSPAQTEAGRIPTPVFRLLGSDPIHQYDLNLGKTWQGVLTLETIYALGGKNPVWVKRFLDIVALAPTLSFSHAQAGQENSFGWANMEVGYSMQVAQFVERRDAGELEFECLGDTGAWFKRTYADTPPQSIAALADTLGGDRRSLWYHSKHYRANLLLEGDRLYLRDHHRFDEHYAEQYLAGICHTHAARFDTLPLLDGFGWSTAETRALGRWLAVDAAGGERELVLAGNPVTEEAGDTLLAGFPLQGGGTLRVVFEPTGWSATWIEAPSAGARLRLSIRWVPGSPASLVETTPGAVHFSHAGFAYRLALTSGRAGRAADGFDLVSPADAPLAVSLV